MASRPLTDGEIKMAQSMYGDSIDYSRVRIHPHRMRLHPLQYKGLSISFNGHLYMYGTYQDDFSKCGPFQRALFIHEMAHVWQSQNHVLHLMAAGTTLWAQHLFKGGYKKAYPYLLEDGKDLMAFNMEQQAAIIEDYFMIKRDGCAWHNGDCKNNCDFSEKMRLYEQTLEKFLNNPRHGANHARWKIRRQWNRNKPKPQ